MTKDSIKNSVTKYKNELEKDDVGVQVVGQSVTKVNKAVKFVKSKSESIQRKKELKITQSQIKSGKNKLNKQNIKNDKSFIKKATVIPISSAVTKGSVAYKENLERDDTGVEITSKSATFVKQSVVKANKVRNKLKNAKSLNTSSKKLHAKKSKLAKNVPKNQKISINKSQLQKRTIKKQLYNSKSKSNLIRNGVGLVGKANTAMINYIKTFKTVAVKKAIAGKVAALASGGLTVLIPVFLVLGLFLLIVLVFSGGGQQQQLKGSIGIAKNLSPEVEKWRDLVTREANAQGMDNYVDLILAIIQVESGGTGTRDIMQSSESAGHSRNYYNREINSVRQGISYLRSIVEMLQAFNAGFENNARLIAQAYNFGSNFARYVGNQGGNYDLNVAETYSKTVVAPSLGNTTGRTYSYVNDVSESFNKTYLYRNGGNFFYGELVGQYLNPIANVTGDFATVMSEILKYNGQEYVWGGKSPSSGFDCSGLVAWGLKQIGINLPSPASLQYDMTVPISASEAQQGDLIFFKGTYGGPNHVSHVGFYVDANTMYDANGSGVGYTNWKSSYWQKHKPEIRRIVQ